MPRYTIPVLLIAASPACADPLHIVTDIAPVHALVSSVTGELAAPELLLPRGADPHTFQMRPSQMRTLTQADLVFWVGSELTPWLERSLTGAGTAETVALLDFPATHLREADHSHETYHDDNADHDEHNEHEHAEHEDDETDSHDGHAHDPHAWLSPENGVVWLQGIAETLAKQDPDNAERYRENAALAQAQLQQTDAEIAELLAPVKDRGFIVFHDAYGYFTDHYNLTSLGAVRESDSAPPSAARLAEIRDQLASGQVHCVFAEAAEGQEMMRDLVDGTGVGIGVLDPSGASLPPGPELYQNLLRTQAKAIYDCLGKDSH